MWKSLRATTREGLAEIDGFLHDQRIDLDSARLDEGVRSVSLDLEIGCRDEAETVWNLGLASRRRIPVRAGTLTIRGVVHSSVEDRARIGAQGILRVTLDADSRRLRFEMCEDGDVRAEIAALDVLVEVADPVVRWSDAHMFLLVERSEF